MQASSSAQPISFAAPPSQQLQQQQRHAADVAMASPGHGHAFNPASYTRAMFGSPVSWRAGSSFGARLYPGTSPSQLFGSFDPNSGKLSSSIESDRGAFMQTQDEFCRNYTCCGLNLSDLHALVEHFEEAHVVVIDPSAPHQPSLLPNQLPHMAAHYPQHSQHMNYPATGPAPQPQSFDPADDMELDDQSPPSSSASSPPRTPPYVPAIATQVPYVPAPYSTLSSQPPSACPSPVSAFDTTAVLPSRAGAPQAYGNYPPFPAMAHDQQHQHEDVAVAPAMLFGRNVKQEPGTSKAAAQAAPSTSAQQSPSPTGTAPPTPGGASETSRASSTLSRPASSLLLSKPFRCPKPNCNKSYKQANGLKYHMTHGSCSFAPPKDLEAVQALLAEKGLSAEGDLSESDAREVEREAERRLRPFACAVGECTRRYKNMNGLRYHYQHSGEHGAEGLRLLASGQHECLQHHTGRARKAAQAQAAAAMAAVNGQAGQGTGTLVPVNQIQSQSQPTTPTVPQQQQQQQGWYGQQYAWQQPGAVHA